EINADENVRWVFSFLSADRRRTYCLYEAPSPDAIVAAAKKAKVPVDAIVEVGAGTPGFSDRLENWAAGVGSAEPGLQRPAHGFPCVPDASDSADTLMGYAWKTEGSQSFPPCKRPSVVAAQPARPAARR